jgi:hypothetical protein
LYAFRAQRQARQATDAADNFPYAGEKRRHMKYTKTAGLAALALFLTLSVSAFAGSKDGGSTSFELAQKANVAGTELKPGLYKLEWQGSGSDVHVQFKQGRNVVASSNAKLVDLPSKERISAAVLNTSPNGTPTLAEARMAGKQFKLVFDTTSEAANHQSGRSGSQQ